MTKSPLPRTLPWLPALVAAGLWLTAVALARAEDAPPPLKPGYEAGLTNITKIAGELFIALEPKKQQAIQGLPIQLDAVRVPCISPIETQVDGTPRRTVQFSAGFVQFVNLVAHSRALTEPGQDFVKTLSSRLANATTGEELPSLAEGLTPEKAWGFDTMNVQAGQFNQLAGTLVAINLAHHYLGHYRKYGPVLSGGPAKSTGPIPALNSVLSEKEWREAVLKGAKNALDCGLGVDGLKTLLECVDGMPERPAWTVYFVHPKATLSKVSKDLQRLENDFFLVEK